jgi:hypothetical protein
MTDQRPAGPDVRTPSGLAMALGVEPKALRGWLRKAWPRETAGGRWELSDEQIVAARERFAGPSALVAELPTTAPPPPVQALTQGEDDDAVATPAVAALALWSPWHPLVAAVTLAPLQPGVYLARQGFAGPVVYVGMAGERRGQGIRGRLKIYSSGKGLASGLGEAVFDRALADADWLRERLTEVEAETPRRAKDWGKAALAWADVQVCWTTTTGRVSALLLETAVLRALSGRPAVEQVPLTATNTGGRWCAGRPCSLGSSTRRRTSRLCSRSFTVLTRAVDAGRHEHARKSEPGCRVRHGLSQERMHNQRD